MGPFLSGTCRLWMAFLDYFFTFQRIIFCYIVIWIFCHLLFSVKLLDNILLNAEVDMHLQ